MNYVPPQQPNQPQMVMGANGQMQYEKNPNGGYLNPSQYGGHFGDMDITPELLMQIQQTGKISIKITPEKMNTKGEPYVRITAKAYDDSWRTQQGTAAPAAPVYQAPYPQAVAPQPAQVVPVAPAYAQPVAAAPQPIAAAPAPIAPQGQPMVDEIPF